MTLSQWLNPLLQASLCQILLSCLLSAAAAQTHNILASSTAMPAMVCLPGDIPCDVVNNQQIFPRTMGYTAIPSTDPQMATKTRVSMAYGELPMNFEANYGQADPRVRFLSRGSGYTLLLTPTEVLLIPTASGSTVRGERLGMKDQMANLNRSPIRGIRMRFVGANPEPYVSGLEELPGKVNYFIGNDPDKWRSNIPTYAKVKYHSAYPSIDLVYYGRQGQLEYDLIASPGADITAIKLLFEQVGEMDPLSMHIDDREDLVLQVSGGELRLHKPRVYQEVDGVKQTVASRFLPYPGTADESWGRQVMRI
jgi:hypothetical protein